MSKAYQPDPHWRPNPSPDRSNGYIQEVLYDEDPQVKQLWRLPKEKEYADDARKWIR